MGSADAKVCSVCGKPGDLVECEYTRRGMGGVCPACCEKCHKSEPFPCRDYDKRKE